ncbi:UPF0449 C19orf25 homolog isoform X1 [Pelobates cultripes]|uniref:UPF0449 C19orf25 homolog isoform X1 n=1 Tax=Pelobates cultripes TaxID=61616 RepID=A0AAD1S7Q6_PELCU|nr:UPF0449 C19orf25 homolog isoform X1 [Pelobates cultripes]
MCAPPHMYDFSLWYHTEDSHVASIIATMLEEKGYQGYVEHRDAVAGLQAISVTSEVIQSSRVSFILLSPHSLEDCWYKLVSECCLVNAIENKRAGKVIPVYVDIKEEQRPQTLQNLTSLSYNSKYFQKKLLDSLKSVMLH